MAHNGEINQTVMTRLIAEAQKVIGNKQNYPVIIAIDGNCGSGKTFYGAKLATTLNACLIHCDDFFLPKQLRTKERLAEVGGNIHYERLRTLLEEVKTENPPSTFSAYNCSTDTYEEKTLPCSNVVIVEGSYSLHSNLAEFYDLKILFTVDKQTQYKRLLNREGEQGIANFINKWIPLENRYFENLDTADCIVIDTSGK